MNQSQINEILKLNEAFYKKASVSFSNTRQNYWKGWGRAVDVLSFNGHSTINVLDAGCGNGRFLGFLKERLPKLKIKYTGVDISEELLTEARTKYPDGDFIKDGLLEKLPEGQFDLVVCFGVTHHIPGTELRTKFFTELSATVANYGYLIITFWNFDTSKAVKKLEEKGDYLLSWDNKTELQRFCHFYDAEEKKDFVGLISKNGLTLIDTFCGDGKNADSNDYFIFRKN
ncbi:hypothetical protein A2380_03270 [candidate division WWE3 bacterium RIFOXYB1_FULL_43_24]|uniref:Methyltransferase domain-containing protein n=2 Tax=Katanobacteria TaxID=422282 RepID=A0A0G0YNK2_UNCKA|nr:MAG: hypothetical protein UU92_C0009G0016 [candidate division WWE3 bacterium GW2011_GWA1_42_12]KKS34777.1 MAG: hypothetical protein UU97_C0006G0016 [candidate division WWE3 bacterium GW2011_GWD1_42_14]KKS38184.1 MAG: hypothetical protein UV00_C0008G0016 [candidate division WWE3 bacterium GW2011_GWF1_42_14]KKS40321.1 MAG: hypothetical protein UV03_C0008G0016 [candidate division WWE3 bacterium GW2011_GWE1_42_16]KKS67156.1 MAG: hypothetical protein UV35_C0002G0016 [candidate division WWE3 bacte